MAAILYKDLVDNSWHPLTDVDCAFRIQGEDLVVDEGNNVCMAAFVWGNAEEYGENCTIIRGKDNWKIL